jgi:hypothetical protein
MDLGTGLKRGSLNKKKGDGHKEITKWVTDKPRPRDLIKNTYNKSKEAETESSRSEIGPQYLTDKGNPIPIVSPEPIVSSDQVTEAETLLKQMFEEKELHVKQLSGYDPSYNCHSYVFTDGKAGWIADPCVVENIIKENGFQKVASADSDCNNYEQIKPLEERDIIIYRNENNKIVHSGVIFKFNKDSEQFIVRSKFGEFGIFEHSATFPDIPNGFKVARLEIYHTDRPQGRFIREVTRE